MHRYLLSCNLLYLLVGHSDHKSDSAAQYMLRDAKKCEAALSVLFEAATEYFGLAGVLAESARCETQSAEVGAQFDSEEHLDIEETANAMIGKFAQEGISQANKLDELIATLDAEFASKKKFKAIQGKIATEKNIDGVIQVLICSVQNETIVAKLFALLRLLLFKNKRSISYAWPKIVSVLQTPNLALCADLF